MGEAWLNARLAGKGWVAKSAGVAACDGVAASPEAVEAMQEWNMDLSRHRSRRLTPVLVQEADVILAMTEAHRREILRRFSQAGPKTFLVNGFGVGEPQDMVDPFGGSVDVYRHTRDELARALGDFLVWLAERNKG
jgi:protein-tyrosine-phosphatase